MTGHRNFFILKDVPRMAVYLTLLLVASMSLVFIDSKPADARVQGWQAGYIISDYVFTNSSSMSVADIQNFLNARVPECDTWGVKPSEFGGGTRRQWAEARGYKAPFTCLRDYRQNNVSSAQIIHNVSQKYQINPQVLLVLLQKEQSLVTDTWPLAVQYRSATGYGCPDTAPCDSQYYGLTNQLDWAAKMFRSIMNASPGWYTPYVLGTNFIRYSPDASCGGSNVNIQNRATQALYNYTPYQPNEAALNADWGSANCGAYGNRNFYLYFTNWFGGTTQDGLYLKNSLNGNLLPNTTLQAGDFISSPDGRFIMTMQYDGNLIIHNGSKVTWHSNTGTNYGAVAKFQADGNLVVYRINGTAAWHTSTNGSGANTASLKDDGNLYIHAGPVQKYATTFRVNPSAVSNTGASLASGVRLSAGSYLKSTGDRYSLVMQSDGNLVLYTAGATALWNSRTHGNPGAHAIMQADGNLVVYSSNGKPLWNSGTSGKGVSNLAMQADGNLVVYSSNGKSTWNSGTWQNNYQMIARGGTNQLASGARLNPAEYMQSPDWRYRFIMQADGNLVVYSVNKYKPLWNSRTHGNPGAHAIMQADGNLVVYSSNGKPLWNSGTSGKGVSNLAMQADGNLVVYSSNGKSTWNSGTNGRF